MAAKPANFFEVGEIRPARDSDFQHFVDLADGSGWTKKIDKNGLLVWMRNTENASMKMFKVCTLLLYIQYVDMVINQLN